MKKFSGKTGKIYEYLKNDKGITSMQAFELFGATRLSAVIFNLRKFGCVIESVPKIGKDRYGTVCRFVEYQLLGEEK